MEWWLQVGGWVTAGFWLVVLVPSTVGMLTRSLVAASDLASREDETAQPEVTVVIAARDEAAKLPETLATLLASEGVRLSIVCVNDRSTDETGAIADRFAAADSRVRAVHVTELPDGWLGKNHAHQVGAAEVSTDLVLFTDGDILFAPDAIARSVAIMRSQNLDHLCLIPTLVAGGYWEDAFQAYFALMFVGGTQPWLVQTPLKFVYSGIGAFNLLRTDVYRAIGAHERLRLEVLDDVKLGKLVKEGGYSQNVMLSDGRVRVKWQSGAWGVIRGLEKNAFAGFGYSLLGVLVFFALIGPLALGPYVAPFFLEWPAWAGYLAALVITHATYATLSYRSGGRWTVFFAVPVAALAIFFSIARSAALTLWNGGVRWRDTFYPLDLLRKHRV